MSDFALALLVFLASSNLIGWLIAFACRRSARKLEDENDRLARFIGYMSEHGVDVCGMLENFNQASDEFDENERR